MNRFLNRISLVLFYKREREIERRRRRYLIVQLMYAVELQEGPTDSLNPR
jgi:hypothetical protein